MEVAMPVVSIYAQLNCSDLGTSTPWFEQVFAKPPDTRPMNGLVEWHHRDTAGLQLFENKKYAGHGTLTLIVDNLQLEQQRLEDAGLSPGPLEPASSTNLVKLSDPDGNTVVLVQSGQ
jgi:hypothetical protein